MGRDSCNQGTEQLTLYVDTGTDSFSEPSCHVQIKRELYEIIIILTINYNTF